MQAFSNPLVMGALTTELAVPPQAQAGSLTATYSPDH